MRVLEFNPNAEEQASGGNGRSSLVARRIEEDTSGQTSVSLRNKQYMTDDPKVLLVGQRNRRIGLNIEKDSNKLAPFHYKDVNFNRQFFRWRNSCRAADGVAGSTLSRSPSKSQNSFQQYITAAAAMESRTTTGLTNP